MSRRPTRSDEYRDAAQMFKARKLVREEIGFVDPRPVEKLWEIYSSAIPALDEFRGHLISRGSLDPNYTKWTYDLSTIIEGQS